jgi:hypothetical protein
MKLNKIQQIFNDFAMAKVEKVNIAVTYLETCLTLLLASSRENGVRDVCVWAKVSAPQLEVRGSKRF